MDGLTLDQARAMRDGSTTNAQPNRTGLAIIEPAAWDGQPVPARRWIVEGLIPRGAVTMLGGDGGLGKSLLTMQLLTAASTGRAWLGLETAHVKAWGLYCEDEADELHRRMTDILDTADLGFADLENMQMVSRVGEPNEFIKRDKYGKPQGPSDFYEQVRAAARSFGAQVVILDGLHDLFDGNENSRPEARQFINYLRRIALDIDGAVVLCAHPSMAGLSSGSGTSGSTAWNNAVRSRLYLTKPKVNEGEQEDPDARVLKSMKSNYGKAGDAIKLRWSNGVFVRDDEQQGSFVDKIARRSQDHAAFMTCLDTLTSQGRLVTDASNSPRYAPKIMVDMEPAKGIGFKRLQRAMNELFDGKEIKVGSVKGPDRHLVKAIVHADVEAPQ